MHAYHGSALGEGQIVVELHRDGLRVTQHLS
jgi:hypothetical protein